MSESMTLQQQDVREKVRAGYAAIAQLEPADSGCCVKSSCCGADAPSGADALAASIGYATDDLAAIPSGANMGLSCGNPTALAALRPGEVVVDLGSGGGFDIFIAGRKVGATGRAIGVDMTPEMLGKARRNAETYRKSTNLDNVEFRLGEIEHLPLPNASADVIISNCVINLSPDKAQVWREIARVLKPGGRVAVSDLALRKPLPPAIAEMVEALIGCVAGAALISETERMAREAGLQNIVLDEKGGYIDSMTTTNDPLFSRILDALPQGTKPSDYVVSLNVSAVKA
ncbi:MAG: arsenite methyltransferase [Candidatus Hydrogenedentes bacterium]|nr:arsenite methyltransferase [Candidatus Hydrogenedentota bacterium]